MSRSSISKLVTSALVATLCLSMLSPAGRAAEPTRTSKPRGESSTIIIEGDVAKVRPDGSKNAQPLNADEVQEISARAEEPGQEVAGGALSNQHLTYIVIALAAAVIVLIAK